ERKNNFFEADIVLTRQDVRERGVDTSETGDAKGAKVEVESIGHKRKGIRTRRKIWPSRIIPAAISSGMNDVRPNILAAMKEIHDVSCVRFKDKEAADKHWIQFVRKNGCSSKVGREYSVPGKQEVSIGIGCNSKGIILHEIMHAIGFWHEQSRTDRDKYLSVQWQNIKPGQEKNFNKYPASEVDFAGGMYDFDSLMHYGNYAFSKNRKPTLVALKNPKLQFGRTLKLSKTDILQLNAMYDCKTRQGSWSSWTDWGPCDQKCTVVRERFCAAKDKSKCPGVDADGIQSQKKRCETDECNVPLNGSWGRWGPWSACSVTCGKGYQTRSRMCNDPPPQFGGDICEGMLVEVQKCEGKTKKCKKGGAKSRKKKGQGTGKQKRLLQIGVGGRYSFVYLLILFYLYLSFFFFQSFADRAKSVIMAAIKEFHRHTCLRFKPRGKERSWIRFVKRHGCWSRVGKQFSSSGPQLLSVGPGCDKKGIIMHELMHAVGFWHEQSRTDRNKYVEVLWENVAKGQAHNFNKYSHGKLDYLGAMYDFQSLMHYGSRAFSKNGKRTIKALKQSGVEFGQRKGFSETDIQQLNALYDCKTDSSHPWSSWTKFGPCNDRCQKIRQRFCMSRDRNQCYGVGTYGIQKQTETCSLNECYAPIPGHWGRWSSWSSCGVSCGPGHRFRSRLCDDPPPKYGGKKCLGTRVQAERCWNKNC
ncbi:unnamed protein product, partial [Porites lobata]